MADLCQRLGVAAGGKTYAALRRDLEQLTLSSGLAPGMLLRLVRRHRPSWTDEQLAEAVAQSRSLAEVLRRLGYTPNGGVHRFIKAHIVRAGLDTSHFTGQAWMSGRRRTPAAVRRSLDEVLTVGSLCRSSSLRDRLIRAAYKEARCEFCGLTEWRGQPLPLELDHINGHASDNRLENLRILCPNCHAQTETWCRSSKRPA